MKSFLGCMAIVEKNKPYVAMLFIQFVYAGMALLSKAAISKGMNPYVFVVYRQAFASIALSPFAFFDRFSLKSPFIFTLTKSLIPLIRLNKLFSFLVNFVASKRLPCHATYCANCFLFPWLGMDVSFPRPLLLI